MSRVITVLCLLFSGVVFGQLQKFENCTLVPVEWSDGDSFQVLFPDGSKHTIRIYGADCLEMHVQGDDSSARRLRDQRRYFGIADILTAKAVGEEGKTETDKLLSKPFTVFTAFADARGDSRFSRVYGFVITADGENLSEVLVARGLARAYGVPHKLPDGTSGEEWRDQLKDLELTAARAGRGAWAHTDWEKLPQERKEARNEVAELKTAQNKNKTGEDHPIDINHATAEDLMKVPGVGEKTAAAIIAARPFRKIDDLVQLHGISPAKFDKMRPFLTITPP